MDLVFIILLFILDGKFITKGCLRSSPWYPKTTHDVWTYSSQKQIYLNILLPRKKIHSYDSELRVKLKGKLLSKWQYFEFASHWAAHSEADHICKFASHWVAQISTDQLEVLLGVYIVKPPCLGLARSIICSLCLGISRIRLICACHFCGNTSYNSLQK